MDDLGADTGLTIPLSSPLSTEETQQQVTFDLGPMDLIALEGLSLDLAQRANELEGAMWLVLWHIQKTEKWRATHDKWELYIQDWLTAAVARTGNNLPYSLREAQQRLSNLRRLAGWAEAAPDMAARGSSDVMARLTRRLGVWDNDGTLKDLAPRAKAGLDNQFPGLSVKEQVAEMVSMVGSIPTHSAAIETIDQILGTESGDVSYDFMVRQDAERGVQVSAKKVVWDTDTAEAVSEQWFATDNPEEPWPDDAVLALKRLLNRTVKTKDGKEAK